MDDLKIITKYVSVWGWHLNAMLFLTASIILISLPYKVTNVVFFVCFFVAFLISEQRALKKKNELLNGV